MVGIGVHCVNQVKIADTECFRSADSSEREAGSIQGKENERESKGGVDVVRRGFGGEKSQKRVGSVYGQTTAMLLKRRVVSSKQAARRKQASKTKNLAGKGEKHKHKAASATLSYSGMICVERRRERSETRHKSRERR